MSDGPSYEDLKRDNLDLVEALETTSAELETLLDVVRAMCRVYGNSTETLRLPLIKINKPVHIRYDSEAHETVVTLSPLREDVAGVTPDV